MKKILKVLAVLFDNQPDISRKIKHYDKRILISQEKTDGFGGNRQKLPPLSLGVWSHGHPYFE
ncbi:MAG: hypothetical protein ABSE95_07275 [Thermodesulfobacteriota bacterium]|jgi:hypothetical protein